MPIGSKDKGDAFDTVANAAVVSGSPVIVGGVTGVALVKAAPAPRDTAGTGPKYTTVQTNGEWKFAVAGTLTVGALVYVATGTPVAGSAEVVTLTATPGTGAKKVFGFITGVTPGGDAGTALVALSGTTTAAGPA